MREIERRLEALERRLVPAERRLIRLTVGGHDLPDGAELMSPEYATAHGRLFAPYFDIRFEPPPNGIDEVLPHQ
jgi:hypothetical protein